MQRVAFTNDVPAALRQALMAGSYSRVAVLVDATTRQLVLPRLADVLAGAAVVVMPAGDTHKTIDTVCDVWRGLQQAGATRSSVLVNVGGGVVTDLGGFAAATYKRGLPFINVPTTLLGAVDAALGGKTGVNFGGLKNQVGAFAEAADVIVSACFFDTLPREQLLAGYAEMVKHALLSSDEALADVLQADVCALPAGDLLALLRQSVEVKRRIVASDPLERGPRKALNLGHTVGHALESLMLERGRPVAHGTAVAWGLVAELVLSHLALQFPSAQLHRLAAFVRERYAAPAIGCDDYAALLESMHRDKKSQAGEINCTLLRACGQPEVDCAVADDDMRTALDIFRDLMGV